MQTTKSRSNSLNVTPKNSPTKPHNKDRKLKTQGSNSDHLSHQSPLRNTAGDKSPNFVERRSPRTSLAEKKKPSKVSELESQLARLLDELKSTRDELASSESSKKKAEQDADEAKIQLATLLAQLDKTRKQLHELSDSDDSRIEELRKISHDRDKEWQSELEAVRRQHSMDLAALASALHEIQRLKAQLNRASESEACQARNVESAHAEVHRLRVEFDKTLEMVERLKRQLAECRESEEQALEEVCGAQMVLEVVKEGRLKMANADVIELFKSMVVELEESRNKARCLEGDVRKFRADLERLKTTGVEASRARGDALENLVKTESCKRESDARLEDSKTKMVGKENELAIETTVQIKDPDELANLVKTESCRSESDSESKSKESKSGLEDSKTKMAEKENELAIETTVQIKDPDDLVNLVKIESCRRESDSESKWKESNAGLKDSTTKIAEEEKLAFDTMVQIKDPDDLTNLVKMESCRRESDSESKWKESNTGLEDSMTQIEEKENILAFDTMVQINDPDDLANIGKMESCRSESDSESKWKESNSGLDDSTTKIAEKENLLTSDTMVQIKDPDELVNLLKTESCLRESDLESNSKESSKADLEKSESLKRESEESKRDLVKTESCRRESNFESKSKECNAGLDDPTAKTSETNEREYLLEHLKSNLFEKETHLRAVIEENESLKSEISKKEVEDRGKSHGMVDAARAAEQEEALTKLENMGEEVDKSSRKVEQLTAELDASQAAASQMEAELRRLKVQSDQWRKAAEVAAAILSHDGKFVEKTENFDCEIGGKIGSPFLKESGVKKSGNVLKKIGVLLKKGQK